MSLKWRIALGYSLVLIVAITAMSGIIVWRFQQILYDQAETSVNATMHAIVQFAQQSATPFSLEDSSLGTLQFLFNSSNLATWNTANSYVQVDSSEGYPLAKTANLGGLTIPPNPKLSAAHDVAFREETIGGRSFLVEDRYLKEGRNSAIIHVAEPLDTLQRTFARARQAIEVVLGTTAAAVVIFSIVLASQVTTPINELSREMREISLDRLALAAGTFDGRLRGLALRRRRDEIGRLATSFNGLLARLAEAFARERQFISDASHELKTPLTSINANAQMLLRWGDQDRTIRRESLETIARESADLAGMVNGMLTLAKADRGDEIPKEPLSLAQIASEVVKAPRRAPPKSKSASTLNTTARRSSTATRTCCASWSEISSTTQSSSRIAEASTCESDRTARRHGSKWPTAAPAFRKRSAPIFSSASTAPTKHARASFLEPALAWQLFARLLVSTEARLRLTGRPAAARSFA